MLVPCPLPAVPRPPPPAASAGPAESLFKESYYQLMKTALKEDGILCCQGEGARVDWVLLGEPGSCREGSGWGWTRRRPRPALTSSGRLRPSPHAP